MRLVPVSWGAGGGAVVLEPASTQSLRPLQAWRAGAVVSELASTQSLRPLQAWRAGAMASEPASAQSLRPLQAYADRPFLLRILINLTT